MARVIIVGDDAILVGGITIPIPSYPPPLLACTIVGAPPTPPPAAASGSGAYSVTSGHRHGQDTLLDDGGGDGSNTNTTTTTTNCAPSKSINNHTEGRACTEDFPPAHLLSLTSHLSRQPPANQPPAPPSHRLGEPHPSHGVRT
ncbi:hypothetical protein V491_06443 [Pseudogymnoascus sp. VKM F-3775]|nr:hypothetical protein V491_06443 [Pseudogymnoascus sp. VKM F-3775]